MSGATIEISAATRRYAHGAAALDGVSLTLPAGQVTALLGPSGSGKSTLLRLIAGLEPLDEGAIRIAGETVSAPGRLVAPEARRVGFVFQDFALFPHLTALANVAFGLAQTPKPEREAIALDWLRRVGLGGRAHAYPHALSGGEQQRVALARALAPQPRAVLLDEPFSGLDPMLRASLRDVTLEALKAAGATSAFVTHDADEALFVADQLAILRGGRLIQAGAPRAVYDAPVSLAAAAALGPVNVAHGRVADGRVATPFGTVPAPGLAEGSAAQIVVRAEAVRVQAGGSAHVIARRTQGAFDVLTITAGDLAWRALVPAREGPGAGADVAVALGPEGVFAFADPGEDSAP